MSKLKEKREEKRYTQEQMATFLGISTSAYHYYETGQRGISKENADKIIKILNVDKDDIFLPASYSLR